MRYEFGPAVEDRSAPMPCARVREVRRHLWLAQAPQLFRGWPDAAFATNPLEESHASIVLDDVLERRIDGLGDRLRAENLLRAFDLLAVDDQRSLVWFGYLLSH